MNGHQCLAASQALKLNSNLIFFRKNGEIKLKLFFLQLRTLHFLYALKTSKIPFEELIFLVILSGGFLFVCFFGVFFM